LGIVFVRTTPNLGNAVVILAGEFVIKRLSVAVALVFAALCAGTLQAQEIAWLPIRDQNPFVLGSGLPLLPQAALRAGNWSVDASITESNTQLISSENGRFPGDPGMHVVFGAETRESRVTVNYAIDENWSARASLGDEWIGVGFLDKPIQHFHQLIGAPKGFRGGRLGEKPPVIRVTDDGAVLYELNRPGQALAPLLFDLTRTWAVSDTTHYGLSLGAKLSTGDTDRLSDTGDTGESLSAFGDWKVLGFLQIGARVGYLHVSGNDVLPTLARSSVPYGDFYMRSPLAGLWSVQVQYDMHAAPYKDSAIFLSRAGVFSVGLVRPIGTRSELMLGLSDDVPVGHTQDVSLLFALRYRLND
jgi:hypothetical protein